MNSSRLFRFSYNTIKHILTALNALKNKIKHAPVFASPESPGHFPTAHSFLTALHSRVNGGWLGNEWVGFKLDQRWA